MPAECSSLLLCVALAGPRPSASRPPPLLPQQGPQQGWTAQTPAHPPRSWAALPHSCWQTLGQAADRPPISGVASDRARGYDIGRGCPDTAVSTSITVQPDPSMHIACSSTHSRKSLTSLITCFTSLRHHLPVGAGTRASGRLLITQEWGTPACQWHQATARACGRAPAQHSAKYHTGSSQRKCCVAGWYWFENAETNITIKRPHLYRLK
jgi:hypothetical protein